MCNTSPFVGESGRKGTKLQSDAKGLLSKIPTFLYRHAFAIPKNN